MASARDLRFAEVPIRHAGPQGLIRMSSLQNAKRRIIHEAIQSNLEGPLVKARRKGVQGRIIRWALAAFVGTTAVLAITSIVMAKSKAAPSIAVAANPALASDSAQHTEVSVPSAPPTDLSHAVLPLSVKRIVIDPGHGGEQPGAISATGLQEKDVTLDIALRLRRLMEGS